MNQEDPLPGTHRLFLLGAGFAKPAGLPLAVELLPLVKEVARAYLRAGDFSHLEAAVTTYISFLADVAPGRTFDIEEFGAWLDWEHILRMKGSDTFSEQGNQAGLQLRWAIGKVLHDAMPAAIPDLYVEFARHLTVSDTVMTLNYDVLLERALDSVGLPYRRYPSRYSEIYDLYSVVDSGHPQELVISKLHGSVDWTVFTGREEDLRLGLTPLVEGPRPSGDPLARIGVIPAAQLAAYYSAPRGWWENPPLLLPPSTAKPLAGSPLIPLWDGIGLYAYMRGGFSVIGCSLPPGDPYVLQLVHHIATDYVAGRQRGGVLWPQRQMKVVDLRRNDAEVQAFRDRFRFFDAGHTDFILRGFKTEMIDELFS